jgi:hypothetical protein
MLDKDAAKLLEQQVHYLICNLQRVQKGLKKALENNNDLHLASCIGSMPLLTDNQAKTVNDLQAVVMKSLGYDML